MVRQSDTEITIQFQGSYIIITFCNNFRLGLGEDSTKGNIVGLFGVFFQFFFSSNSQIRFKAALSKM